MHFNSFLKIICNKNKDSKENLNQFDDSKSNILVQEFLSKFSIKIKKGRMIFRKDSKLDRKFFEEIKDFFEPYLNMTDREYKDLRNRILAYEVKENGVEKNNIKITTNDENVDEIEFLIRKYTILFGEYLYLIILPRNRRAIFCETLFCNFKKVVLVESYIKNNKNIEFKDIGKIKDNLQIIEICIGKTYSFIKNMNIETGKMKVENFCFYIVDKFIFYRTNGENRYPKMEEKTSLTQYIEEYKNILSENTIESIGFKFLLEGKENYFYKLYNIVVSGENIDFVGFYDIVLNLLYSKNAPCDVFNNIIENFPESKLLDIIQVFINKSIFLIIEKHSKNNPDIVILNNFYKNDIYNEIDFIHLYLLFANNNNDITKFTRDSIYYVARSFNNLINIISKSIDSNEKYAAEKGVDTISIKSEIDKLSYGKLVEDCISRKTNKEEKTTDVYIDYIEIIQDLRLRKKLLEIYYYKCFKPGSFIASLYDINQCENLEFNSDKTFYECLRYLENELFLLSNLMKNEYLKNECLKDKHLIEDDIFKNFDKLTQEEKSKLFSTIFQCLDIFHEMKIFLLQEILNLNNQKTQLYVVAAYTNYFHIFSYDCYYDLQLYVNESKDLSQESKVEILQKFKNYYKSPRKYIYFIEKPKN